ncbi:hypothetical protein BY996DRAFT_7279418 [Phakopsora pachyrhizi]|nr:hypothetical protein BY996DRAFT_7279418 [Phakopsora pachyrhizi]
MTLVFTGYIVQTLISLSVLHFCLSIDSILTKSTIGPALIGLGHVTSIYLFIYLFCLSFGLSKIKIQEKK